MLSRYSWCSSFRNPVCWCLQFTQGHTHKCIESNQSSMLKVETFFCQWSLFDWVEENSWTRRECMLSWVRFSSSCKLNPLPSSWMEQNWEESNAKRKRTLRQHFAFIEYKNIENHLDMLAHILQPSRFYWRKIRISHPCMIYFEHWQCALHVSCQKQW